MVDRDVFDRRLSKLEDLLRSLRELAEHDWDSFKSNEMFRASAERWLQLASECALDLAHHLVADRGWKSPTTNREAFETLAREGVLTDELAEQMTGWAGLRNVLVHLYLALDDKQIYKTLTTELSQLEKFAEAIAKAV